MATFLALLHKLPLEILRMALIDVHIIAGSVWLMCVNPSLNQHLPRKRNNFGNLAGDFGNLGSNKPLETI